MKTVTLSPSTTVGSVVFISAHRVIGTDEPLMVLVCPVPTQRSQLYLVAEKLTMSPPLTAKAWLNVEGALGSLMFNHSSPSAVAVAIRLVSPVICGGFTVSLVERFVVTP